MRIREKMYGRGIFKSHHLAAPVISVGNLTMGGTGKTPMVQHLARLLQDHGFRPAVISRGYGGRAQGRVNLVSDGRQLLLNAELAGDEPRFLAETLPGVPVLTGLVRRLPAQKALEMGADVVLLDDGFQHLQVVRDVNLVLFNADRLAGNSRVFPGGELREPVAALRRATGFLLTGVNEENRERAGKFAELLRTRFAEIPVALAEYAPHTLVKVAPDGSIEPTAADGLIDRRCFAFCGIARPERFRRTLERQGLRLVGFHPFADHQRYSPAILRALLNRACQAEAEVLITTEKDLVKLSGRVEEITMPLFGLRMQVATEQHFDRSFLASVKAWQARR
ncbi:tetraacyldisaccharide 4'-kinase [Desulfobulbus alkaliphilus]|nr:tetraacyldisaccharide 4'-kinase [Desulfobulbus alkaliphilus]